MTDKFQFPALTHQVFNIHKRFMFIIYLMWIK